ncbi:MAG TPA: response regulator [Chitinophagaceae bacterium]|nr:response regulator [Chitinophagaceae bacterium]
MELFDEQEIQNDSVVRILVVDDREDNLISMETLLEKDHYDVCKANSGRAALRILLHEHDFSLILMDVQMPDMNGYETANLIYQRDKLRNIPIIFITAHSHDEEYIFQGYQMGGVDYIYKPVHPTLLRAKVGVFVELYRKNHQLASHEKRMIAANESLKKEIDERRLSEQKIRLLNEQLVENINHLKVVNEELDRFAYMASHDLQEPLRKIMVFTDKILKKMEIDGETDKYLKKIFNSSERMQTLINDLLRFSKHEIHEEDFKPTDLNVLVQEAITELEMEIEMAEAKINIDILPTTWAIPGLITQLFYNLISNAIKFKKGNNQPVISIFTDRMLPRDMQIELPPVNGNGCEFDIIYVTDNGIGFDARYAEDIFIVFKRLHSYEDFKGSGVGLSICKKIVEKHHGFITVRSKEDEGSTFIIGLPQKHQEFSARQALMPDN